MYGINIVNIFLSGKRKNIFLMSILRIKKCFLFAKNAKNAIYYHYVWVGAIFAPAIAAPSRDAVCLAHFLSGGMWLSDRNDAEL